MATNMQGYFVYGDCSIRVSQSFYTFPRSISWSIQKQPSCEKMVQPYYALVLEPKILLFALIIFTKFSQQALVLKINCPTDLQQLCAKAMK